MKNNSSKIAQSILAPGLTEETVIQISATKNEPEWLLNWRLKAFKHWQKMTEPNWAKLQMKPIDYQKISYQAIPKNFNPFGNPVNSIKIQKKLAKIANIKTQITHIDSQIEQLNLEQIDC